MREECKNGCPENQVCDDCQGTGGTEWKEITDPEELFRLKREGWEIEVWHQPSASGFKWLGTSWSDGSRYRARPPQPKMKKVKLLAYLSEYELRWLNIEAGNKPAPHWIHVPAEDKTIEVADDN